MTAPFDADDLFKRGFLSSLIPFRKKKRENAVNSSTTQRAVQEGSSQSAPILPPISLSTYIASSTNATPQSEVGSSRTQAELPVVVTSSSDQRVDRRERTQFDIYREIVRDAELIESTVVTPLLLSPSASPSPYSGQPAQQQQPSGEQSVDMAPGPLSPPTATNTISPPYISPIHCPEILPFPFLSSHPSELLAPPPYSLTPMYLPPSPQVINNGSGQQLPIKPDLVAQPMAIEDIVRLVVEAMQKSGIEQGQGGMSMSGWTKQETSPTPSSLSGGADENPHVILQRKRKQNNEAAARYRKRQKEAREKAEIELQELLKRNTRLRDTISDIELQINLLRQRVWMHQRISPKLHDEPDETEQEPQAAEPVFEEQKSVVTLNGTIA